MKIRSLKKCCFDILLDENNGFDLSNLNLCSDLQQMANRLYFKRVRRILCDERLDETRFPYIFPLDPNGLMEMCDEKHHISYHINAFERHARKYGNTSYSSLYAVDLVLYYLLQEDEFRELYMNRIKNKESIFYYPK